jgi:hypothetical protein
MSTEMIFQNSVYPNIVIRFFVSDMDANIYFSEEEIRGWDRNTLKRYCKNYGIKIIGTVIIERIINRILSWPDCLLPNQMGKSAAHIMILL